MEWKGGPDIVVDIAAPVVRMAGMERVRKRRRVVGTDKRAVLKGVIDKMGPCT